MKMLLKFKVFCCRMLPFWVYLIGLVVTIVVDRKFDKNKDFMRKLQVGQARK